MTTTPLQPGAFITNAVRLIRPLAEGGMGRVWIAEHQGLHSKVVVKLMAEEMAARPDGAERFAREAAVAAAIKSPHTVQIFDHGLTAAGVPYIVMELLEGKDLGAYLAEHGRIAPLRLVPIVVQIGKALSKAHKASIVHRDIKPDNIFLCDTDDALSKEGEGQRKDNGETFVKLLDFGTAKREHSDDGVSSSHTVPGQIMGTPYYMSPEQSVGAPIDEHSDIWSLGVVVFEAITGRKPFDGASLGAITIAIHSVTPKMTDIVPELVGSCGRELDEWFARACAQLPQDRFSNVRDATDAFVEVVTGSAPSYQPTESILFPLVKEKDSTPVRSFARPIEPLIDTLPVRGAERRVTTIAATLVMGAAAIAMLAIVLGRSPSKPSSEAPAPQAHSELPPMTHGAEMPPLPVLPLAVKPPPAGPPATQAAAPPPVEPAPPAPKAERRPAPIVPAPSLAGHPPAGPARDAHARPVKKPRGPQKENGAPDHQDDDLVRLRNAAAQHSEPAPPNPPPPSTPESPTPPPLPAPAPPVAPAAAPPAAPAPAPTVAPAPAPTVAPAPAPTVAPAPAPTVAPAPT